MKRPKFMEVPETVSEGDRQPRFVMTCDELWDNEEQVFWVRKTKAQNHERLIEVGRI